MSYKFNFDYSKTLWMKMFLARPDFANNRSEVLINFETALDIIKKVDNITQGITKIVYLVGWQGLGHDDCYPEMEKVNDFLKRDCDDTGRESLLWLIDEAKKYHTVVSFHGNIADEYGVNKSHPEFVAADALCNGIDGKPAVIEIFNGRDAYKTSYKQYWESGLFKKYFDRFCEAVPVREAGTVHLDNFCIAESLNPRTTMAEQDEARNAMLDYVASLGIDVTTEYTYRELDLRAEYPDHPIRKLYSQLGVELAQESWTNSPIRTLGRIPASWWTSNMTPEECISVSPSLYSGHLTDSALGNVFYGAMHGEDIWMNNGTDSEKWSPEFIRQFCTYQLPYFYLNRHKRLTIEATDETLGDRRYTATFSDGIVSRAEDMSITKNGTILKQENDVILPVTEDNRIFIAYSENGREGTWNIPDAPFTKASVYEITADGNVFLENKTAANGTIELSLRPGEAVAVIGE